jgi:hypothetical protein
MIMAVAVAACGEEEEDEEEEPDVLQPAVHDLKPA